MTANPLSLTLPYPPSVNHYWGVSGKRRFISKRGVDFRRDVKLSVQLTHQTFKGRIRLYIEVYPPDRRIRDLDNLTKAILDSLTHAGVYTDDSLVDELTIVRREVLKGGKLEVRVLEMVTQH